MRVALTFDTEHPDQPGHAADSLERMLDVLAAAGVPATFFIQGRWAEAHPDTARRIADEGHLVGNHSYYHYRMSEYTTRQLVDDLRKAEQAIIETTGCDPKPWFRLPFHSGNENARVIKRLRAAGYEQVFTNCDPGDWVPTNTAGIVLDNVVDQARGKELVVVDLHSWPRVAADAFPDIVRHFGELGAEFVTVDALRDQLPALRSGHLR
jgi:peptidoglycan/xylan/chitin deacetylase (PgdA/CDA1 family)